MSTGHKSKQIARLARRKRMPAKVKIIKRKGRHSVALGKRPISSKRVRALLNALP